MKKRPAKNPPDWLKKAYNNYDFLNSPSARGIRVLAELIEPQARLRKHNLKNTLVFFGSARFIPRKEAQSNLQAIKRKLSATKNPGKKLLCKQKEAWAALAMSRYYEDGVLLAEKLTRWFQQKGQRHKKFVICSGGGPGIMEAASRGAQKAKGKSIGLNISLPMEQEPNPYHTKELTFEFHYFFIRKFWFVYPAKALVVFPGGFGTMDELFELLTLIQTHKSTKYMPVVLYGRDYWKEVINFEAMVKWGMISPEDVDLFKVFDDVENTFTYLTTEIRKHHL